MKNIFTKIILFFVILFAPTIALAQNSDVPNITSELEKASDSFSIEGTTHKSSVTNGFLKNFTNYFFTSDDSGKYVVESVFFTIAKNIKNIFLVIAVIFLIIGVINIFLASGNDSSVTKWKNNIVYTTVGIIFMQMSFAIWQALMFENSKGVDSINAVLSWQFWSNIIAPFIGFIQWLASFAFLAMMFYAFYIIVTGAGDEDKLNKWKSTLVSAIIGFMMIYFPYKIVTYLYGGIPDCSSASSMWDFATSGCNAESSADLVGAVNLVSSFFTYFNSFLTLACVIMAIYAGFLYMTAGANEDNVKKAKNIIIYIAIGLILLVASHAIFVFFFNAGGL